MSKILIIDGNLFARKMFYQFRNLSCKVKISDLSVFSEKFKREAALENFKEDASSTEILDPTTGKVISVLKKSKIDNKIKELSENHDLKVKINTGVTFGVIRSLIATFRTHDIGKIIICYDPLERNRKTQLRTKLFKEYKASRAEDSRRKVEETVEFYKQLSIAHYLLYYMGIKQVWTKSFEADDLLHYYSQKVFKNKKSLTLTNDHDLFQTIDNNNSILLIGKDSSIFDKKAFVAKYGISPSRYLDVMSLCGCSSDEVPGLKGIGEIEAISLIKKFKSLENLIKAFEENWAMEMKGKTMEILIKEAGSGFKTIIKTRKLVKLYGFDRRLKSEKIVQRKKYSKRNFGRVIAILETLKFRSVLHKKELKDIKRIMINQKKEKK